MKAKLIVNGKELEVEISEQELEKFEGNMESKKTGYERVNEGAEYYLVAEYEGVDEDTDMRYDADDSAYETANYYSSKTVAENNARADKLMRQLRRFAVENRETELDWNNSQQYKYDIRYDHYENNFLIDSNNSYQYQGIIYFDTKTIAQRAIDTFHDDLVWYFTEYRDSL